MRKAFITALLGSIALAIVTLFWYNDWMYAQPTPVPKAYISINSGETIDLSNTLGTSQDKPLFLHFFNPSCPCSRFNMPHFQSLVKKYGAYVDFAIVLISDKTYSERDIQQKYELSIPVYFDSSIAAACGVYSTPQAAIIDTDHRLHYRGNYNRTRYCTDKKTNYAQIALEGLLQHNPLNLDGLATKAYGCQLPKCTK